MNFKSKLQAKRFTQLREGFLAGEYATRKKHSIALNDLYNKMEDVSGLIPLLESNDTHCQYVAAYIAASEGERAAGIFKYIFPLINSTCSEVIDEVCDCFLSCTEDPVHYLALLNLLKDEQSIRLRVITIIFDLSNEVIAGIHDLAQNVDYLTDVEKGMKILMEGYVQSLSQELIQKSDSGTDKVSVVCAYVAAYNHFGNTLEFKNVMRNFNEADLFVHYKIYFKKDILI